MDGEVKAEINRLWDENGRQNKRIEILETDLQELKRISLSVEKLAIQMETMAKEQAKLSADMEEVKMQPAKAWTGAQKTIFNTVLGAISGFIVTLCGALFLFGIKNLM